MTDTRRPAPAGAGRRVQPRLDESLTGSVSHEMSTSDLSAAMPGRHRIGTVAGFGLECWPTSRRNGGRLRIGMLADITSERWPASDWNAGRHHVGTVAGFGLESLADFVGIHTPGGPCRLRGDGGGYLLCGIPASHLCRPGHGLLHDAAVRRPAVPARARGAGGPAQG